MASKEFHMSDVQIAIESGVPGVAVGGSAARKTLRTVLTLCFLMFAAFFASVPKAEASAGNNNIKIVAYYGAGNLSKSEYGRDTVILFNPTQASITMTNWTLQTGGSTGTFTTIYYLPTITIPAGGFYALAGSGNTYISSAGCASSHCNLNYAYDYQFTKLGSTPTSGDNNLPSTAVVIALVSSQTALSGTCNLAAPTLVDLIGIGASDGSSPVTCFAGSSYATYTPSTTNGVTTNINGIVYAYATIRKNKCTDTFNNSNDFMLGFIDFYNSATPVQPCPTGTQLAVTAASATPTNPGVLENVKITAAVTPATIPASGTITVQADLSNLGLSATSQLYDDGTHGDGTPGDGTYTLATTVAGGLVGNVPGLIVTAVDSHANTARGIFPLSIAAGTLSLTTPNAAATVTAGGVATFPFTVTGLHGYGGTLNITCGGSPNTNNLGVPLKTQCVSTPNEITVGIDGTATFSLVVATGTTFSAGIPAGTSPLPLIGLLSVCFLGVGVWRRKHLRSAALMAFLTALTLGTVACATNGGLGNTNAAPGVYTYTVTATDSNVATITNTLPLTVTVQ